MSGALPDEGLRGLMRRFPRAGRVEWIGLRAWRGGVIRLGDPVTVG